MVTVGARIPVAGGAVRVLERAVHLPEAAGGAVRAPQGLPGGRLYQPGHEGHGRQLDYRGASVSVSVPDPWLFGVDPDPRIHASD